MKTLLELKFTLGLANHEMYESLKVLQSVMQKSWEIAPQ